jgi:hypothetical protein
VTKASKIVHSLASLLFWLTMAIGAAQADYVIKDGLGIPQIISAFSCGAVATGATNVGTLGFLYGFNGATWDQLQVDASKFLKINCAAGCTGSGPADTTAALSGMTANSAATQIALVGTNSVSVDTKGSGNDTVRADTSIASGSSKKWYFQIVANTVPGASNPGQGWLGLTNGSFSLTGNPCGGTNSVCSRDDGNLLINFSSCANNPGAWGSNGTNIGFAIRTDISPPKLWVRIGGGSWDGTTDDPVTNVGGCDVSSLTFPLLPYFSAMSFNYQVKAQFASASWSFSAPSGFTTWGN